jgi:O-antigen/teichoic acid export membrane protein
VLIARGVLILALGVGANIALARMLEPRDFGVVALAMALLVLSGAISDGGLGAALIRRERPPEREDLEALNGLQLTAAVAVALGSFAVAAALGGHALLVAAIVATLPVSLLKTPSVVVLERRLAYRTVATVDVVEAVSFYVCALATVGAGLGVWGIAIAAAVRALVGAAVMLRIGPIGLLRPRWSRDRVRPLLAFGAQLQAVSAMGLARDQGLNIAVAGLAGLATLGVWSLAWRVLQVPYILFATVGRVTYPVMSRLLEGGENPRPVLEKGVATVAVATAIALITIVGAAPAALPALLGSGWDDVAPTLVWCSLALSIGAPVWVMCAGYLFAVGAAGAVLRSVVGQTIVWFAVTLPLLPSLGAPAVGLGWIAGAGFTATLLARWVGRETGAAVWRSLVVPASAAIAAGALGWWIGSSGQETVLRGALGAVAGETAFVAALALLARPALRDTYRLVRRAATGAASPVRAAAVGGAGGA